MASGYLLGIDVGTTRTAAATCRIGAWPSECEIVNLGDRSSAVPSVLFVGDDGASSSARPRSGAPPASPITSSGSSSGGSATPRRSS